MAPELASDTANLAVGVTGGLVVSFGELLIDFVPTVAGVSLAESPGFRKAPGGAPANMAVGVSRLGGYAAFIGKVGDDEFGHMLADVLKTNNVNVKGLCFDSQACTALAFITLKKCAEREFMFFRNPSADMLMVLSELDEGLIRESKIFHFGSVSLISEPSRSTHMAAMKLARESGFLMSYDPNLRLPLWPSPEAAREGILSIWKAADIVKVSDEEVKFLTNGGDDKLDEVVMTLWHPKLKLLVVTDGLDGCRYYTPGFKGSVTSYKVATMDTTSAGDAFVAGLLHRLANNRNLLSDESALRSALQFACACGAIRTTERGTIPTMPQSSNVVMDFYRCRSFHIFLSHTGGEDGSLKNFPIELCEALRSSWRLKCSFRVFIDRCMPKAVSFPDVIKQELAKADLGIVVVIEEYFHKTWPMIELVELVKRLQESGSPRVRILPLFFTHKPGEVRELLEARTWEANWEQMASERHPITVHQCKEAVETLCD